jgi:hypothetical protein
MDLHGFNPTEKQINTFLDTLNNGGCILEEGNLSFGTIINKNSTDLLHVSEIHKIFLLIVEAAKSKENRIVVIFNDCSKLYTFDLSTYEILSTEQCFINHIP